MCRSRRILVLLLSLLLATACPGGVLKPRRATILTDRGNLINRGLVGAWFLNEGSGTTVNDLSGNGRLGTFATGANAPSWVVGGFGPCVNFDGADYITVSTPLAGWNGQEWTLSIWAKPTIDEAVEHYLLSGVATGSGDEIFRISRTTDQKFKCINDYALSMTQSFANTANSWYHVGVSFSYGSQRAALYVNGISVATDTSFTDPGATLGIMRIGGVAWTTGNGWIGSTDNVRIYKRALSAYEIAQLYREPYAGLHFNPMPIWGALEAGDEPPEPETDNDWLFRGRHPIRNSDRPIRPRWRR